MKLGLSPLLFLSCIHNVAGEAAWDGLLNMLLLCVCRQWHNNGDQWDFGRI